jgi:hypothetical protein
MSPSARLTIALVDGGTATRRGNRHRRELVPSLTSQCPGTNRHSV